jgi:flagellar hook-associated protein 3 FlgL
MRISTNQFLLGSLPELMAQQSNVNQLNREIATGQTMLDAASDPAGAGAAIQTAARIDYLAYASSNAEAGAGFIQSTLSTLQQVGTIIDELQQVAIKGADASTSDQQRQALAIEAQSALQQLIQLGNSRAADGGYIFAGSKNATAPFVTGPDGTIVFAGDDATNAIEVAPGISVPIAAAAQGIFFDVPAGHQGIAVTAADGNTGSATALVQSVTSLGNVTAEKLAGVQFEISITGGGGSLGYVVVSGTGDPGSAGFAASSGVVASGAFAAGADLQFGGIDVVINGAPASGDRFVVEPGASSSLFQTAQDLIAALAQARQDQTAGSSAALQSVQNAIANLDAAQTSALSSQAALGARLAEIQAIRAQNQSDSTNAQVQLSGLQSANLPQVLAHYSAAVTALQAASMAFSRIQGLTLFSFLRG